MDSHIFAQVNKIRDGFDKLGKLWKRVKEIIDRLSIAPIISPTLTEEDKNLHRQTKISFRLIIFLDGAFGSALAFFYIRYIALMPLNFTGNTLVIYAAGFVLSSVVITLTTFLVEGYVKRKKTPSLNFIDVFSSAGLSFLPLFVFPPATALVLFRKLDVFHKDMIGNKDAGLISPIEYAIVVAITAALTLIVAAVVREYALSKRDEIEHQLPTKLVAEKTRKADEDEKARINEEARSVKAILVSDIGRLSMLILQTEQAAKTVDINSILQPFNPREKKVLKQYLTKIPSDMAVDGDGNLSDNLFEDFWNSL
ncbi:MAG: hypothetical protein BGO69_16990 [Bacteroidetes bacterium 46-16]|nr:MAG: hypothetical protein BGO69_16990 [Bacteroidetes bacterium 46-16]